MRRSSIAAGAARGQMRRLLASPEGATDATNLDRPFGARNDHSRLDSAGFRLRLCSIAAFAAGLLFFRPQ
jgi:hypothetical protein